jgi:hypothetical protein
VNAQPSALRINVGRLLPAGRRVGLGTVIKRITQAAGVRPCAPCANRAKALDQRIILFGGRRARSARSQSGGCWSFAGGCTGWGSRRCVSAPARQEPDAEIVTQCCGGWFQYPWIEVCPGESARSGRGFCLW